jgi:hypothetical protein
MTKKKTKSTRKGTTKSRTTDLVDPIPNQTEYIPHVIGASPPKYLLLLLWLPEFTNGPIMGYWNPEVKAFLDLEDNAVETLGPVEAYHIVTTPEGCHIICD